MENWDKIEHDFKEISSNITLSTEFTFQSNKKIKEIEPTCNCVNYRWVHPILKVNWKVRPYTRSAHSTKNILVLYEDGTFDDLILKANIQV